MTKSKDRDDYLEALYTMGAILLVTTFLPLGLLFLYAVLGGVNIGVDPGAYAIGSVSLSGLVAMVYATIKMRNRKRKTGSER